MNLVELVQTIEELKREEMETYYHYTKARENVRMAERDAVRELATAGQYDLLRLDMALVRRITRRIRKERA